MNIFRMCIPIVVLLLSKKFVTTTIFNCVLQLIVFIFAANIPALITGRMSYVDLAWPWGLFTIGSLPFLQTDFQENGLRTKLIMAAYLIAGFRMGMGAIVVFTSGRLKHYEKQEFPRYLYIRQIWAKKGIEDENSLTFKLNMQKEIIVQCIANMGTLCIPLMVQAYGYKTGELTWLEISGWVLWLTSFAFEHTADRQKKQFIKDCIKNNIKNAVCDVGLWRYSRHPNYFGEWMVWNSLIITSIPSLLALWQTPEENLLVKVGISLGLVFVSYAMYQCLVNYTGAAPAEFYSAQKRPDYARYQKMVNKFVPGPRKEIKE